MTAQLDTTTFAPATMNVWTEDLSEVATRYRSLPSASAETSHAGAAGVWKVAGGSYSPQYRLPAGSAAPRKSTSSLNVRLHRTGGFAGQGVDPMVAGTPASPGTPASEAGPP